MSDASESTHNQRSATMTSDVRYASGEVPQVGDVVERVEYPIGYLSLGDQVTVRRIVNDRSIDVGSDAVHYGIKQFKLIHRAHHAQQPAPVETFVPTWGPEWEYVANHGTVFTFLLDDKSDVAPIKLACEFGDVWFSRDGAAAFGASWVIISQRPRTPAPVETPAPSQPADVPQESAELTALRADLARAKEDGERMRGIAVKLAERLQRAQLQWRMYADERPEYDDEKGCLIDFKDADHTEADLWRSGESVLLEALATLSASAGGEGAEKDGAK